jgi:2-methylcitrate dehydratase PrpD
MSEPLVSALSRILGDIARRPLPADALAAARSRLFHAFGVSLVSSRLKASTVAWNTIRARRGECRVLGRNERVSDEDAAFANGVTGHGSLLEDCGPGGLREGSHPGTFIIPAALAAAESANASGLRFLAGIVVGYEAVSRIGAAAPLTVVARRFRPVGIMGPIGAAAAAATILGASDEQLAKAIAIAGNLSGGFTQGIFEGSMEPYFQAGFSARNGLFAARLAMENPLTSAEALEGEFGFFRTYGGEPCDANVLLAPRVTFGICTVGTKRFAACLQNQQTLALIVDGLEAPIDVATLKRVVITRPQMGTNGLNSPGVARTAPFNNMLSAQMSARFTAAAALLGHPVGDPTFYEDHFGSPAISALAELIELVPGNRDEAIVQLDFLDGRCIVLGPSANDVLHPPASRIRGEFIRRAGLVLSNAAGIAAIMDKLETLDSIRTLTNEFAVSR